METLKYAILGLLMKKDMTGYELSIVRILECQPQSDLSEIKSPDQRRSDRISYRNNRNRTGKESIHYHRCRKRSIQKMGRDALSDAVSSQR